MGRELMMLLVLVLTLGLCPNARTQSSGITSPWLTFLGDGSDGAFSCTSGVCHLTDEYWFSSFNISAGATVYAGSGNGPTIVRSIGPCTIAGTLGNTPSILSAVGITVAGDFGGGGGGGGGGATEAGSGGRWTVGNGVVEISNGGSGGASSGGTGGSGQTPVRSQYRPLLSAGSFWPAGGSPGGTGGGPEGGKGGHGGGPVILVCNSINFTGTINVSGGSGVSPSAANSGAGGGGGAGYVILSASSYTANSGVINVAGGTGGSCNGLRGCGTGGNGGNGWSIAITIQ
jgi:hypothetical protein